VDAIFPTTWDQGNVEQFFKRISIKIHFTEKINTLSDKEKRKKAKQRFKRLTKVWKNAQLKQNWDKRKVNFDSF
jgi:ribosomal protein L23